ncbi:unnamed protein product, partial [Calicophoron daubneyi]
MNHSGFNVTEVPCERNLAAEIFLEVIEIVNTIYMVLITVMWFLYMFGGRILKTKRAIAPAKRNEGQNVSDQLQWPSCIVRPSSQIFITGITSGELIYVSLQSVRFTRATTESTSASLNLNDVMCNGTVFITLVLADMLSWLLAALCFERFYIMYRPMSAYSRDQSRLFPPICAVCVICLATVTVNLFYIFQQSSPCSDGTPDVAYITFKMLFQLVVPTIIVISSTIGLIVMLTRRKRTLFESSKQQNNPSTRAENEDPRILKAISVSHMTMFSSLIFILGISA